MPKVDAVSTETRVEADKRIPAQDALSRTREKEQLRTIPLLPSGNTCSYWPANGRPSRKVEVLMGSQLTDSETSAELWSGHCQRGLMTSKGSRPFAAYSIEGCERV